MIEFPDYKGEGFVTIQARQALEPMLRRTCIAVRLYTTSELTSVLNGFLSDIVRSDGSLRSRAVLPPPRRPDPRPRWRRLLVLPAFLWDRPCRSGSDRASPRAVRTWSSDAASRATRGRVAATPLIRRQARAAKRRSEPHPRRDRGARSRLVAHACGRRHADRASRNFDANPAGAHGRRRRANRVSPRGEPRGGRELDGRRRTWSCCPRSGNAGPTSRLRRSRSQSRCSPRRPGGYMELVQPRALGLADARHERTRHSLACSERLVQTRGDVRELGTSGAPRAPLRRAD